MNNTYSKAYTEVLEIINYFPEKDYNKIPVNEIEYYKDNMDKNYKFKIDPKVDLSKQHISKEANAVMVTIFRDFFATEEQKEKIKEILELNNSKAEQEKRKKYNPDDIFKNKMQEQVGIVKENMPIEVKKEKFFNKFINYIKGLLIKIK